MNSFRLIPLPDGIPVHWGWFQFFLILTFTLHLLFMNAMLGGGIIALVRSVMGKKRDLEIAGEIKGKWPLAIAFAVNTGVAPFLFIQVLYGHFIYTSSVLMAAYWLSAVGMLLAAYYGAYLYDYKFNAPGPRIFFAGLSVALLLAIAFFFSNNMTLMLRPEQWPEYFENSGGTILNLSDPTLVPRYLHFVVASVAVGGLGLALWARFGDKAETADDRIGHGMKWFTYATLAQIPIGFWFFMKLDVDSAALFMGGNLFCSFLFIAGMGGTLASIYLGLKNRVLPCAGTVLAVIVIMVLMRDIIRKTCLGPYFNLSDLAVNPQYTPLTLFIFALVAGTAVIVYMLKLAFRSGKEVRS